MKLRPSTISANINYNSSNVIQYFDIDIQIYHYIATFSSKTLKCKIKSNASKIQSQISLCFSVWIVEHFWIIWKTKLNQTVRKDQKKFIQSSVCDTWLKITKMCVTYTLASYYSSLSSIIILIIFIVIVKSLHHYHHHHHHHYHHYYHCMTVMFPQCKKMTRSCPFHCMLTSTPFSQCAQCACFSFVNVHNVNVHNVHVSIQ